MIASNVLAIALAAAGAAAAPLAKRSSGQATYYAAGLGKYSSCEPAFVVLTAPAQQLTTITPPSYLFSSQQVPVVGPTLALTSSSP
jgi:hypothetical protein